SLRYLPALAAPLHLHSFPTRRSSDLLVHERRGLLVVVSRWMQQTIPIPKRDDKVVAVHFRRPGHRVRAAVDRQQVQEMIKDGIRSEEHTSELQSPDHLVCRLLLEKKK